MEIERKYLIKDLPDISECSFIEMIQGYIAFSPTIRIRKENDHYYLTVKSAGMLQREEYEIPITAEDFQSLWCKVEFKPVEKTRYLIPLKDNLTAELDIYKNDLFPLKTVEVEFNTIEEANSFIPPDWFGKDVTFDHKYKNGNLSKNRLTELDLL